MTHPLPGGELQRCDGTACVHHVSTAVPPLAAGQHLPPPVRLLQDQRHVLVPAWEVRHLPELRIMTICVMPAQGWLPCRHSKVDEAGDLLVPYDPVVERGRPAVRARHPEVRPVRRVHLRTHRRRVLVGDARDEAEVVHHPHAPLRYACGVPCRDTQEVHEPDGGGLCDAVHGVVVEAGLLEGGGEHQMACPLIVEHAPLLDKALDEPREEVPYGVDHQDLDLCHTRAVDPHRQQGALQGRGGELHPRGVVHPGPVQADHEGRVQDTGVVRQQGRGAGLQGPAAQRDAGEGIPGLRIREQQRGPQRVERLPGYGRWRLHDHKEGLPRPPGEQVVAVCTHAGAVEQQRPLQHRGALPAGGELGDGPTEPLLGYEVPGSQAGDVCHGLRPDQEVTGPVEEEPDRVDPGPLEAVHGHGEVVDHGWVQPLDHRHDAGLPSAVADPVVYGVVDWVVGVVEADEGGSRIEAAVDPSPAPWHAGDDSLQRGRVHGEMGHPLAHVRELHEAVGVLLVRDVEVVEELLRPSAPTREVGAALQHDTEGGRQELVTGGVQDIQYAAALALCGGGGQVQQDHPLVGLNVEVPADGVVEAVPGQVADDHVVQVGLLHLRPGLAGLVHLVLDVPKVALDDAGVVQHRVVGRQAVRPGAGEAGQVVDPLLERQRGTGGAGLPRPVLGHQAVAVHALAEVAPAGRRRRRGGVEPHRSARCAEGGGGRGGVIPHWARDACALVPLAGLGVPRRAGLARVAHPCVPGFAHTGRDGGGAWDGDGAVRAGKAARL
eukprot:454057-Hanusia_phi.AAC.6